jgi:hypothetical protein
MQAAPTVTRVRGSAAVLLVLICAAWVGCGTSQEPEAAARTPQPAPDVTLTPREKQVWAPLPPDRSAIPVLLYHGIGPESDFPNVADASYGVGFEDFAKQMTMMLDVGRVEDGAPEYLTWPKLPTAQDSGRWQLQLHAGHGHRQIRYGPGDDDYGPFYAYEEQGEDFDGWRQRVRSDIEWGQQTLAAQISAYRPLAFAPPYGSYGQDGTNDPRIPDNLLDWLTQRYDVIFTQDVNARARPGSGQPLGRIQVARSTTGGDLYELLLSG